MCTTLNQGTKPWFHKLVKSTLAKYGIDKEVYRF